MLQERDDAAPLYTEDMGLTGVGLRISLSSAYAIDWAVHMIHFTKLYLLDF